VEGRPRLAWASLGFGLAALAASWNPVSAPFGLATGLGAALLAVRALLAGGRRAAAVAGLVAALAAVAGSALVLALTAGVGRQAGETTLVPQPTPAEVDRALDEAAGRTREARERARGELDQVAPPAKKASSN
jgi:hypothetical protein